MNDFLTTLQVTRDILYSDSMTTRHLMTVYAMSERTLKRRIAHARQLGVDIQSIKKEGRYVFVARNARQIIAAGILDRWLELETEQTLLPQRQLPL